MNTLGYVARQFDVLASSSKPKDKPDSSLPRVSTWSTKSFLFPHVSPRRSHSSPSLPLPPAPLPSLPDPPPRSKVHLESVIDRIFFIRVFLMVWDNLKSAWSSFLNKGKVKEIQLSLAISVSQSSSTPSPPTPPPLPPKKTPFHLPKTLVLDLDETLIHSTSRPIPFHSSGSSLLSLGSFGRRNKGAGHMVEVVLGGRSTLYHVYKRPFVDFFLRTVCPLFPLTFSNLPFISPGIKLVYTRYIHRIHARICRSRHRLARRGPWHPRTSLF